MNHLREKDSTSKLKLIIKLNKKLFFFISSIFIIKFNNNERINQAVMDINFNFNYFDFKLC